MNHKWSTPFFELLFIFSILCLKTVAGFWETTACAIGIAFGFEGFVSRRIREEK